MRVYLAIAAAAEHYGACARAALKVRVEHVNVNEGGQAVIGNLNPNSGSGPPTVG
jgi:hypothetical protein